MEENFSMEWNTEWKKVARMEYGKTVFHSVPHHALITLHCDGNNLYKAYENWLKF